MIAKACPEYSLSKPSTLVAISGAGNVSQFTALKVIELGATVVSMSDSKGSLIATTDSGFSKDVIESIGQLKLKGGFLDSFKQFTDEGKYTYHPGTYSTVYVYAQNSDFLRDFQANAPGLFFPKSILLFPVQLRMKSPPPKQRLWLNPVSEL